MAGTTSRHSAATPGASRRGAADGSPDRSSAFLTVLGRRIRFLRRTAAMTQEELAERAGMSRSFISLLEQGGHGVDVARLLRIAAVLDRPLSLLVADVEQALVSDPEPARRASGGRR